MPEKHTFTAIIESAGGGGAFVRIPFDVEEAFGSKRPPVSATIDGITYRGSLVRMGTEYHILGVLKEIRAKIGKDIGDEVDVVVELDTEPRVVEVPRELGMLLSRYPRAKAAFERMSYTQQREIVQSVLDAKTPESLTRRLGETIEMLKKGKRAR
jgi:hypothetical protein